MSHLELDLCEFCSGRGCESCYGTIQASPSSPHHNIQNESSYIPLSESVLTTTSVQSPVSLQEQNVSPFPPQDNNLNDHHQHRQEHDGHQQHHHHHHQQQQHEIQQSLQPLRPEVTQRAASSRLNSRPIRPRPIVFDEREQDDSGFAVLPANVGDQIIGEQFEAHSVDNTDDEGSADLSHKPPNSMTHGANNTSNNNNNNHSLNLQQKISALFQRTKTNSNNDNNNTNNNHIRNIQPLSISRLRDNDSFNDEGEDPADVVAIEPFVELFDELTLSQQTMLLSRLKEIYHYNCQQALEPALEDDEEQQKPRNTDPLDGPNHDNPWINIEFDSYKFDDADRRDTR